MELEEILRILKNETQINIMYSCITCILKITYVYTYNMYNKNIKINRRYSLILNPWTANHSYSRARKIGHPVLTAAIVVLVHAVCYGRVGQPIDTSWGCRFVKRSLIGSFAF